MKFYKRFIKSFYSPKSISSFRFLGVGSTIVYVLILTFLSMLPMVLLFFGDVSGNLNLLDSQSYGVDQKHMKQFISSTSGVLPILLIVIYIAIYVLLAGILFFGISILSWIGLFLSMGIPKKIHYKQLWVMGSYSITLPVVLFTTFFLADVKTSYSFLFFWVLTTLIFCLAIWKIPSKK
jgi:hypothetical protein